MSEAIQAGRFLGMRISPLNRRRLHNFRANQRGFWSLWIFLVLFILSLLAEFIANDRPFLVYYDGDFYVPIMRDYPETAFGGPFPTAADTKHQVWKEMRADRGRMIRQMGGVSGRRREMNYV